MYLVEDVKVASPTQLIAHNARKKFMANLVSKAFVKPSAPERIVVAPNIPKKVAPEIVTIDGPLKSEMPIHVRGSAQSVLNIVCFACAETFNVEISDILSVRRTAQIVKARQAAFYIVKCVTTWSLPEIGRRFGRDHTTVLHGLRRVERHKAVDADYAETLQFLKAQVRDHLKANDVRLVASIPGECEQSLPEQQR